MRRDGLPVKDFADGRQFEAMTLALKQRHAQAIPDLPRYGRRRDIEPAGALAAVRIHSHQDFCQWFMQMASNCSFVGGSVV